MPREKSELSKLLLLAIDRYERGGDDYDSLCVEIERREEPSDDDAPRRMNAVREATDRQLKSRIFEGSMETDSKFAESLTSDMGIKQALNLEKIGQAHDKIRIHEVRGTDLESAEDQRQEQLSPAQSADLGLYFAKDFVSNLDQMVSRAEALDRVEYSEILSATQKSLLREAHRCYLHRFDAATVVMCGAVLEQTLKDVLKLDWKFDQLLQEAEERNLLKPEEYGMADDVRELRNEAVHDLTTFLKRPERQRATILSNTRAVVGILLSGNSDRRES